ncbi:MAG: aspartate kinase [Thermosediminibacterales bacterium]|nr:aspartate kinase [Thermosediminibacterales bacterium]
MKIIVQKFGGTSVADSICREQVAKNIIGALKKGFKPVVVVSAMGRQGAPYATDTLKNLVTEIFKDVPARELDLIMSCGEIISSVVLANVLNKKGYKAKSLTGGQAGILTDDNFGNAQVIDFNPETILKTIKNGYIPVVSGFQGITKSGEITTLGRGGSDTTAAILGAGIKAERVEIYTDVDGIMTADPRILSEARVIETITYDEVFQLSNEGAKVIHPKAVEIAMMNNVPLVIKNFKNQGDGTLITSYSNKERNISLNKNSKVVTGIAHTANIAQVTVISESENSKEEIELFNALAQSGISIDLINLFPKLKVFTIKKDKIEKTVEVLEELKANYKIIDKCVKISLVGAGMRDVPGVMARVVKTLNSKGIKILQTSDSNTTISVLIEENNLVEAVRSLHREFHLDSKKSKIYFQM